MKCPYPWLEIYKVSALTLPFNIACLIWFSFTLSSDFYNTTLAPAPVVLNASQASVPSATTHDEAIYGKLWAIFPRGVAQIFLCGRYESGIIILVAMASHETAEAAGRHWRCGKSLAQASSEGGANGGRASKDASCGGFASIERREA